MLKEIGSCSGVENYSRVLSGREPGSAPYTLLDYFPEDFIDSGEYTSEYYDVETETGGEGWSYEIKKDTSKMISLSRKA